MTTLNWRDLKPHVPLGPGDALYVERPGSAGEEIAQWILADRSPLLIGGPAGIGKSTEVARAAELLQPDRVACLVQLDRFENMRRLTPDRMRLRIIQKLGYLAQQVLGLPLSESLSAAMVSVNAELDGVAIEPGARGSTRDLLNATLKEAARLSRQGRVALLIDGLEKAPEGPGSEELFEALAAIRDNVDLVVVIPWHAAFGPQAETVIRAGEHFLSARPVEVEGDEGKEGRAFLRTLLLRRLGLAEDSLQPEAIVERVSPEDTDEECRRIANWNGLTENAIRWSGGVPRVFLQLMAGAGLYGARRHTGPWPTEVDLADARADHVESIGRLFLPGDEAAIRAVVGTSGRELDLARKVRLMAHGVLLERIHNGETHLELHPLAEAALTSGGRHA